MAYVTQDIRSTVIDRLTEHKRRIKNKDPYSEMSKHVAECKHCAPLWQLKSAVLTERNDHKCLIKELTIMNNENAINKPSLSLVRHRTWKLPPSLIALFLGPASPSVISCFVFLPVQEHSAPSLRF